MHQTAAQCRYLARLTQRALAKLDDSHRALEPRPDLKTAGWLIGHLAVTGDFGRHLCGGRPVCPREWRAAFNPGTTPSTDPAQYPPMRELGDTFRAVYGDLYTISQTAEPALLAAPNPYTPAIGDFPTAGDFLAYLMTGHIAYHLGQLTEWCAAAGLGRVLAAGAEDASR
ncbi:MAG TPA: DinB family protein [Gemmatimonadaceae bacterium]|nr:DinB family protein [Gemmatimonadaceae bacterium]